MSMARSVRLALPVVALAAAFALQPSVALAGEPVEEPHASFVWYILNFIVLLAVLVKFGGKPIQTFLVQRKEAALAELRAAERLRDDARAKLAALEERLSRIEIEIQSILDGTLKLAESERDRIIRGAEETAERIRAQAGMMLEQEVRRARQDLAREVTDSATREATALLAGSVSDADQDRLVREFAAAEGRRS